MLFPDQNPAPIVQAGVPQGVPQSPAVQAPPMQAGPVPGPAPQMQQVQAPPDPEKVSQWKGLMERISQPDVLGPLQTFLAVAAAPRMPGESMGARMAYAGTVAQLHRSMLEENARMQPYYEKERALKLQQMEAEIARTQAGTEASQASTRRTNQQIDQSNEDRLRQIDLLDQQIRAAKLAGDAHQEEVLSKQRDALLDAKFGERSRKADIRLKETQADYYTRIPKEGGPGGGKTWKNAAAAGEQLRTYAEMWARDRATTGNKELTFADWAKQTGVENDVSAAMQFYNANKGPKDPPITLIPESQLLGKPGTQSQAPLGSPQNPITKRPASGTFPPGLPDRIPK